MNQRLQWYAIITKYKCEKYVVAALKNRGIEAYVPLLRTTKRYVRKIKRYEVPLISCYVFVRIRESERIPVLEVPYVHRFVQFDGRIVPVPDDEVRMMQRVVGELSEVTAVPRQWLIGDKVEVIAGKLTGLQGILVGQNGKHEFVVELETLGYQLRMSVDSDLLREISRVEALAS
jgi:transcription antitermination factor NusG